jgi:hypothetical protein
MTERSRLQGALGPNRSPACTMPVLSRQQNYWRSIVGVKEFYSHATTNKRAYPQKEGARDCFSMQEHIRVLQVSASTRPQSPKLNLEVISAMGGSGPNDPGPYSPVFPPVARVHEEHVQLEIDSEIHPTALRGARRRSSCTFSR